MNLKCVSETLVTVPPPKNKAHHQTVHLDHHHHHTTPKSPVCMPHLSQPFFDAHKSVHNLAHKKSVYVCITGCVCFWSYIWYASAVCGDIWRAYVGYAWLYTDTEQCRIGYGGSHFHVECRCVCVYMSASQTSTIQEVKKKHNPSGFNVFINFDRFSAEFPDYP